METLTKIITTNKLSGETSETTSSVVKPQNQQAQWWNLRTNKLSGETSEPTSSVVKPQNQQAQWWNLRTNKLSGETSEPTSSVVKSQNQQAQWWNLRTNKLSGEISEPTSSVLKFPKHYAQWWNLGTEPFIVRHVWRCLSRVTACVACGFRRACHGVCCVWFAQGVSRRVACGFRRACTRGASWTCVRSRSTPSSCRPSRCSEPAGAPSSTSPRQTCTTVSAARRPNASRGRSHPPAAGASERKRRRTSAIGHRTSENLVINLDSVLISKDTMWMAHMVTRIQSRKQYHLSCRKHCFRFERGIRFKLAAGQQYPHPTCVSYFPSIFYDNPVVLHVDTFVASR